MRRLSLSSYLALLPPGDIGIVDPRASYVFQGPESRAGKAVGMDEAKVKAYPYRWLVLAAFMVVAATNQGLWITFAPITTDAVSFWGASEIAVGLLSMVFMIVYVLLVLPAAWLIDTWGFRRAVQWGAVLTALGALGRAVFADRYPLVFASQVVIAMGQPLVLGAITKLAARWFLPGERATATGLGTLSMYLGILSSLFVTPLLYGRWGMAGTLVAGMCAAAVASAFFLAVARERPPTPAGPPGQDERSLVVDGLKSMLRRRDFLLLLAIFFVGLGVFNGVTTWIEVIVAPRGFSPVRAGTAGAVMLVGGVVGAVVLPLVSDAVRRRKPFVVVALVGLLPGLLGLTFATSYGLLLASAFVFGFFLLSAGPIGFQYGAEITLPAPEGTSNSLLIVMGQVSGIVFIVAMDALKSPSGSMTGPLLALLGLTAASALLSLALGESPIRRA